MGADQGLAGVALRADGAEDPGGAEAVVAQAPRPLTPGEPPARQPALLPDTALVGEPDFQPLVRGCGDLLQHPGEVFLNAAWAFGSLDGCAGRTDIQAMSSRFSRSARPLTL